MSMWQGMGEMSSRRLGYGHSANLRRQLAICVSREVTLLYEGLAQEDITGWYRGGMDRAYLIAPLSAASCA